MTPLRLLIADDHTLVRQGLRRILEGQPGWEVVAETGDGREACGNRRQAHHAHVAGQAVHRNRGDFRKSDCRLPKMPTGDKQARTEVPSPTAMGRSDDADVAATHDVGIQGH